MFLVFEGTWTDARLDHRLASRAMASGWIHFLLKTILSLGGDRPQGADVFSYAPDENDLVQDPLLSEHLSHWGIDVMKMEKVREGVYVCWRPLSLCAGALLISLGPRQDKAAGAFMHDGLSRSHATWMTDGALLHGKDHTVLRLLDPLSSHSITSLFFF
jgi:hypothetical protein